MYYLPLLAFLDKWCNFKWSLFNGCHNEAILSFGMNNVAFLNIYGFDYRCIIFAVSKIETVVSLNDADFFKNIKTYNVNWYWNWKTKFLLFQVVSQHKKK